MRIWGTYEVSPLKVPATNREKERIEGRKDAYVAVMATEFGRVKKLGTTRFEGQNSMCFISREVYRLEEKLRSEGCNEPENGD